MISQMAWRLPLQQVLIRFGYRSILKGYKKSGRVTVPNRGTASSIGYFITMFS